VEYAEPSQNEAPPFEGYSSIPVNKSSAIARCIGTKTGIVFALEKGLIRFLSAIIVCIGIKINKSYRPLFSTLKTVTVSNSLTFTYGLAWITLGINPGIDWDAGSILPILPGPPIAYAGVLLQQLRDPTLFHQSFMDWAGIVVISWFFDYIIPPGHQKFGGTRYGSGLHAGFILHSGWVLGYNYGPSWSICWRDDSRTGSKKSFRAAVGSFVGFW